MNEEFPYKIYEQTTEEELNVTPSTLRYFRRIRARIDLVEQGFFYNEVLSGLREDIRTKWISRSRLEEAIKRGRIAQKKREKLEGEMFIKLVQQSYIDIFNGMSRKPAEDVLFLSETIPRDCLVYALEKGGY